MRAIVIREPGGPEVLQLTEVDDPVPGPDDVLIDVTAAGVNHADLFQRMGFYPPPPGASPYPGLECSGRIAAMGENVAGWRVGQEACALLAGGGYAEQVVVPAGQLLPVPAGLTPADAAALPEVACTVYSNVFMSAGLSQGETLLVHGGASGIGTIAIQLGKAQGAKVACTAGSAEKLARCAALGADCAISYKEEDFVARVHDFTGGKGADVILDIMGGSYLSQNLAALATGGRLVVIGTQGGSNGDLDLRVLLGKRASVRGASLRPRPVAEKSAIVSATVAHVWPLIESGRVHAVIDRTLPLADAAEAHRIMEASTHVGKILLTT
jgi:putative PIG3 family NAD(P)H quinone oxidoreductase